MKNDIYHDRFLAVYLLPFFEIKSAQAEFVICYVTFNSLQNGKKILKKKVWNGYEKWLTLSVIRTPISRKTTSDTFQCPAFIKIFI